MKELLEIEYKILLNKETFYQILQHYQSSIKEDYIQTNHYFTHPLLSQKKWMLRIREKKNSFEMTLKRPQNNHRLETNINLSLQEKDDFFHHRPLSNEIINILRQEGINPLEVNNQFSLTTHRYDIPLDEGMLSLDHSTYLDKEDYELEFEVNNEEKGYQQFLEIIKPFHLTYQGNCLSKIQRVLENL